MTLGFAGLASRNKAEIENRVPTRVRRAAGRHSMTALAGLFSLVLATVFSAAPSAYAQSAFGAKPVGTASSSQTVSVPIATSGTVTSMEILTGGASGLDFAAGAGASTCTGNLTAGTPCTASVIFTPSAPGARLGAVVVVGTVGATPTVLGTAYLSGTGTGSLGVIAPGNTIPVAGQADTYLGIIGDGGPATSGVLYLPTSIALDGAGNMYIADSGHDRVRMVCASTTSPVIAGTSCTAAGNISTVAGNGSAGNSGNGPASSSQVSQPSGVAVDGAGNVYIADTANNEIREIVAATGQIVVVAGGGTGCAGQTDTAGDGCTAIQASLNGPLGVTLDLNGNIFIADTANERIREVKISTGIITTVAGTGFVNAQGQGGYNGDNITAITAELNTPYAVAFDAAGNMYIPDSGNDRVRMVAAAGGVITPASLITTFAGDGVQGFMGDTGPAAGAEVWAPSGVALDAAGNVYIADTQNQAIRKVNSLTGKINTLIQAGVGTTYYQNNFLTQGLYAPTGITLDAAANVYIADTLHMVIRQIQSNFVALDYKTAVRQGSQSTQIPVTIEDDGNAALDLTAITPGINAQLNAVTTTCVVAPPSLNIAADCAVGAIFAPTTSGNPLTGTIQVTSQTINTPLNILLVGDALAVNSTTTAVTSAPNPSNFGQNVTFTVTVTTGAGTGNLTGTVSLQDTTTGTTLATGLAVNASGVATFQTSTLAVGQHAIVASYGGDTGHFSSTSTDNGGMPYLQTVNENTTTTLASSLNPSLPGQNVTFTATVAISSAGGGVTPDGTVTFMDGTTALATVALASGSAQYSTTALAIGVHPITAVFSGDSTIYVLGSTSKVLNQEVQGTSTLTLTSSLNPSIFGQAVTFTAALASTGSSTPTGTVTFYDGAAKLGTGTLGGTPLVATYAEATFAVGTHQISAVYAGDANNTAATSNTVAQVVNPTGTTTTVAAVPNPGIANEPIAITATVRQTGGSATPTGTVTFTSGATTLGTATLAGGTATINPALAAGTYQVIATYNGDSNNGGSASAALTLTVNLAVSTTTLTVAPNPAVIGATVTFTASVTGTGIAPTGTVSFLVAGNAVGTATLKSGAASFTTSTLAVGTYAVTASYSGDTDNAASTSAATSLSVTLIPTTTGLATSTTTGANPQTILIAVVEGTTGPMPTGTVTFTNGTTTVGSATLDASGVATLTPNLPTGTYSIVASYGGDAVHAPSKSAAVSISGAPAGFDFTVTPATVSLQVSQNATLTVNITSEGGFTDTIGLGCGSLPAGVSCLFSTNQVKLGANGTATAQLSIDTNNPLGGGATAMNAHGKPGASLAGLFLPLSAGFGLLFWRARKRNLRVFTLILVMALSAGALLATGCSGYSSSTAAPGTYTIQVTGTGTSSNVIHFQNVALTITK